MLLSVTGASGAGKSTALAALRRTFAARPVVCVEFDAVGVPPGADTAWRHGALEAWAGRAVAEQARGRHLVLCGQVPIGELLAAPSVADLDAVAVCVLHCSGDVRRARLTGRGEDPSVLDDHVAFGEWFYRHAHDPTHAPEVIRVPSPTPMRWERWERWQPGDPRWSFEVIDTDELGCEEVGRRVVAWAKAVLAGERPCLSGAWAGV